MSDAPESEELLELEIPDGVPEADQAVELIRAWIADGTLMVTLNGEALGDRMQDWGRLLAQIAHHVARSSALNGNANEFQALTELRKGFDALVPVNEPTLTGKTRRRVMH
ncbi:DUF5076 domain-containing protein [Hyphomicrobium methylovorum]|uniref:DUF5076 domain-containing protein n=1 Tax=Hyphomicrobium methylovorum TaxID=84 RepID=UPI0015E78FBF|nr:DUF5076 domain-containing protein [Hyphomicrobium methylovorum]MBA2127789.1 DUF5076 domain-containing protein [Hyphomicrobium methylovorum]